ncbi:NAD(P)/FAD-dependent oxidoreductase [Catellatospora coxensis]
MTRRIIVVGAGIVGTAVAERLGARGDCSVTVVEQSSRGRLTGSTGHAPGFIGLLADQPAMIELARRSVDCYRRLQWQGLPGFEPVGALELAHTSQAADQLTARVAAAATAGISATLLDPAEAVAMAPRLADPHRVLAALHLPEDGAARAAVVTCALQARAAAAGVRFLFGTQVTGIEVRTGRVASIRAGSGDLPADDVVLACGIWGGDIAAHAGVHLPLFPILHPYAYSAPRAVAYPPTPLVRWPEARVYARDHGDRDGFGTSDHRPVLVAAPSDRAELDWPGGHLDDAVDAALALLPRRTGGRPADGRPACCRSHPTSFRCWGRSAGSVACGRRKRSG